MSEEILNNSEVESNEPEIKITQKDLNKVYRRSFFDMASINYERFQALGFLNAMAPVLEKLYPDKEDLKAAMKRHMEMYNSHPWMINPILGTAVALEEKNANGGGTANAINGIKVGLMGPFAGIGDSLFWGTLRPILGGIGAAMALNGNVLGPILFLALWNIINFGFRKWSLDYGYRIGMSMLKDMKKTNIIQKVTEGASVLGLMVLGVLVAQWINIKTGIEFVNGDSVINLQEMLDSMVPSLLPLLVTFGIVSLLRNKVKPNTLILVIFVIAFILAFASYFTGIPFIVAE